MKKLLNLFGTVGLLVAPVTTIVSCNSKNKSESNGVKEETNNGNFFAEAINDYKKEVNEIITRNIMEANKNLIEIETENNINKFLKKEKIKEFAGTNSKNIKDSDKNDLKEDVFTKLAVSNIKKELNDMKNKNKYNIILDKITNVYDDLEIEWSSLQISYKCLNCDSKVQKNSTDKEGYTSNILLSFKIKTLYTDQVNKLSEYNVENDFIYSLTNSQAFMLLGETINKELEYNYLLDKMEQSDLWLDPKMLGFDLEDKDKNLVDDSNKTKTYYQGKTFEETLLKDIKNKLLNSSSESDIIKTIELSFSQENIDSKIDWKAKLNSHLVRPKLYDSDMNGKDIEGQKLFKYVFNRTESLQEDNKVLGGTSQKINVQVFNYLNSISEEMFDNYKKAIDDVKNEIKKDNKSLSNKVDIIDFSSTSQIGYVYLKGLQFTIGDYVQKLPEFRLLTAYSVDKNTKNWINGKNMTLEVSKTLESIYYNIIKGIDSFRNTFGIVDNYGTTAFTTMSGKIKNLSKNLWDTFGDSTSWFKYDINNSTSLNYSSQKEFRDYLLKTGNQEIFSWTLFGEKADTVVKKTTYGFINNGTVLNVIGSQFQDVNLRLDFININFRIKGYWNYNAKGKHIIERIF